MSDDPRFTITAPDITELPRGAELQALLDKVTGNAEGIKAITMTWKASSFHVAAETAALAEKITDVDKKWEGESADAFNRYMLLFPKAGTDFNSAVHDCSAAVDKVAAALQRGSAEIRTLCDNAVGRAQRYIRDYMAANPTKEQADARGALAADASFAGDMNRDIDRAKTLVKDAEDSIGTARSMLTSRVRTVAPQAKAGMGFFFDLPFPGGTDFDPGEKKVIWNRTPQQKTQLSGENGSGGGPGSGGPGAGGVDASAKSTPAPKAEVVEWIKQALTVIRSPEMADTMRERGIDVTDLDPNDPQDVQRIWTIIYHESGGNPNAVNTWDINAKNGIPSQGLMQTIPPTFNAHALPGHEKILDPVDNIIAGVLYTYSRYGNLAGHPGIESLERGGGYQPY
ncbi:transglycosylase SLT domain-containing protein [Nonomuraea sp. NPDC049758]|uniref:transglycosylase SLT domain-containing protein n=1 Tax=Nonomuraea sp. NPDC049758 TaxID=3154360 RepID=UPI00342EE20B